MAIVLDGTNGINTPDLEASGPITGTTGTFSGNLTLGSSVLTTPTGSAPSYTCRAWVNFNGTGTVAIRAAGNVTSITDNGTGDYTMNFTAAMSDVNFGWSVSAGNATGSAATTIAPWQQSPTSSSLRIAVFNGGQTALSDLAFVSVAIFR